MIFSNPGYHPKNSISTSVTRRRTKIAKQYQITDCIFMHLYLQPWPTALGNNILLNIHYFSDITLWSPHWVPGRGGPRFVLHSNGVSDLLHHRFSQACSAPNCTKKRKKYHGHTKKLIKTCYPQTQVVHRILVNKYIFICILYETSVCAAIHHTTWIGVLLTYKRSIDF